MTYTDTVNCSLGADVEALSNLVVTFKDTLIDYVVPANSDFDEFFFIKDIEVYGDWSSDALVYLCEDLDSTPNCGDITNDDLKVQIYPNDGRTTSVSEVSVFPANLNS